MLRLDFGLLYYYILAFLSWRRALDTVRYMPQYVSIEATNSCNFKCSYCPQSGPDHFKVVGRSTLDPKRAAILLGRLREGGVTTSNLHWTLDGEPFMNKRFQELCALAVRQGFTKMMFASNGALCTPARLATLPRDATYVLTIDYCADRDHFERVRGTEGSWQQIRDNVNNILNDPDLHNIRIVISDISGFSSEQNADLRARFEALRHMFQPSKRIRFATRKFHNATGFLPMVKKSVTYRLCPYPWSVLSVASNGDVVACSRDLERKTVLGNLLQSPLPEVWNGEAMKTLRRNLRERRPDRCGACAKCDLPYDASKFTLSNFWKSARGRLNLVHYSR